MRLAGIEKMFLLGRDYSTEHGFPLVSNEDIKKLVDMKPARFIGFASVDPNAEKSAEKLKFALETLELSGLALYPSRQHFYPCDEKMDILYDICEMNNKPIIFHSGLSWEPNTLSKFGHPLEFEELANKRPNLRICLTQFGWPWIRETAMLLVKHRNIFASMGSLYFDSAQEFFSQCFTKEIPVTWIDRSLRHQVMFGSANPRFEQIRMAKALNCLGFRESTLELIKWRNAEEFLNGREAESLRGEHFVY